MAEQNKGFIIYYDNEIIVGRLSDDEAGKLFKSLFPYATERIKPNFEDSPALAMAFDVLSLTIDRNAEWYKQKCEKNRENIKKRWEKKHTNEYGCNKTNTNEYGRVPNKEKNKEKESTRENIDYQQIADMYNATCVSFPQLKVLSDKRKKAIKARLNTYTVEDFKRLFEMAEGSSFLKGANNRNWSATFDWLIADGNMAKVLDGNYQDKQKSSGNREQPKEDKYADDWIPDYMRGMNTYIPPEEDIWGGGGE